jgi:hypothetical protein
MLGIGIHPKYGRRFVSSYRLSILHSFCSSRGSPFEWCHISSTSRSLCASCDTRPVSCRIGRICSLSIDECLGHTSDSFCSSPRQDLEPLYGAGWRRLWTGEPTGPSFLEVGICCLGSCSLPNRCEFYQEGWRPRLRWGSGTGQSHERFCC